MCVCVSIQRNINVWLPLAYSQLGTWPATQACALTGNQTSNLSVCRRALSPLSHTTQGPSWHSSSSWDLLVRKVEVGSIIDVLLRIQGDDEELDIHYLFTGTELSLQISTQAWWINLAKSSLKTSPKKSLSIGPGCNPAHLALVWYPDADELLQQCVASKWRHAPAAPGQPYDIGQSYVDPPHLTFVPYLTISFSSWSRRDLKGLCRGVT